jgi:hypothetical protein
MVADQILAQPDSGFPAFLEIAVVIHPARDHLPADEGKEEAREENNR